MSMIKKMAFRFSVNSIASFFKNDSLDLVLKFANGLLVDKERYAVYRNVFRILALFGVKNESYKAELGYLVGENQLGVFGQDEQNYILIYILDYIGGNDTWDVPPLIDVTNVSKKTKQFFPIDTSDPILQRFFVN